MSLEFKWSHRSWFHQNSLLQAYITQHNDDIICLLETFLDSSTQSGDNKIKVYGYNLKRPNHPSNSKKDGVCIYYKEHIPLIKLFSHRNSFPRWKMFLNCIYPFQARIINLS